MSLFNSAENPRTLPPLAERMRPATLAAFLGQQHLVSENRLLAKSLKSERLFSIILWGPPGCGKTTLAKIIAGQSSSLFFELSAVSAGVKDVREALAKAKASRELGKPSILFIDEIHRFNKAQRDALLQAVENGVITLIGATTLTQRKTWIGSLIGLLKKISFSVLRILVLKGLPEILCWSLSLVMPAGF